MKKSLVTLTTVAVVGLGSVFVSNTVQAETISGLKDKQTEVHSERSSIKANLSEAESKIADVMIDLKERNKKIKQVEKALTENQNKMDETKGKITDTKGEVNDLEDEITTLEDEIEARYEILKERIVSYQKSGGNIGYMDVIFGSKSFGEFISRVSAVNKITQSDEDLMKAQEKAKKDVEAKQDKVKEKLADLKDMKVELEGMQETILVQKKQNEKAKEALTDKKQDLEEMKEELQIKDSSLAAIEAEVSQSIAQKNIEHERAIAQAQETAAEARQEQASSSNDSDSSDDNSRDLTTLSSEGSNSSSPVKKETQSTPSYSAPSTSGGGLSAVLNAGKPFLGMPYNWGGKSPSTGFDCSGFVSWAYSQAGVSIPSSTSLLKTYGQKVPYSQIQPGDLVFFFSGNSHVGIYVGGGKFIGAQNSTGLAYASMTSGYWEGQFKGHVRRVR